LQYNEVDDIDLGSPLEDSQDGCFGIVQGLLGEFGLFLVGGKVTIPRVNISGVPDNFQANASILDGQAIGTDLASPIKGKGVVDTVAIARTAKLAKEAT